MQYSVVLTIVRITLEAIIDNMNNILRVAFPLDAITSSSSFAQIKMKRFWRLSEMYLSLCDVSDNISLFYSLPMLLSLPYIFITLIFLSHYVLQPVVIVGMTAPISLVFHCIFRIAHFLILLILLTKLATATVTKVRNYSQKYVIFLLPKLYNIYTKCLFY